VSYSRWSSSFWYTYWSTTPAKEVDAEVFEIAGVKRFTYKELKQDVDAALESVRNIMERHDDPVKEPLLEELRIYMDLFKKDVEEQYNRLKLSFEGSVKEYPLEIVAEWVKVESEE